MRRGDTGVVRAWAGRGRARAELRAGCGARFEVRGGAQLKATRGGQLGEEASTGELGCFPKRCEGQEQGGAEGLDGEIAPIHSKFYTY